MANMARWSKRVVAESGGMGKLWPEMMALCGTPGVVNLGQGFPDFAPPKIVVDSAAKALTANPLHQYSPVPGLKNLQESVAGLYGMLYGDNLNPATEIVTMTSATEGLYVCMQAIINPGDEVVVFEPFFPWYLPCVRLAGGVPKIVTLDAPGFRVTRESLEKVFSDKTRAVMLNTPHNPTGHCLTKEELELIGEFCKKYDALVVSDEVYESCVFPGSEHLRIRDVEGMKDRTLTISAASKMLSVTGWRVGWVYGPEDLVAAVRSLHAFVSYCAPTPLQQAVSDALNVMIANNDKSFEGVSPLFHGNFEILADAVEKTGATVCPAQGGYFLIADISKSGMTDYEYVYHLAKEKKVGGIPLGMFYQPTPEGEIQKSNLVRFAVCKQRAQIEAAARNLLA